MPVERRWFGVRLRWLVVERVERAFVVVRLRLLVERLRLLADRLEPDERVERRLLLLRLLLFWAMWIRSSSLRQDPLGSGP